MNHRVDIQAILRNPVLRRRLIVTGITGDQAREGIKTTPAQAAAAYDAVKKTKGV